MSGRASGERQRLQYRARRLERGTVRRRDAYQLQRGSQALHPFRHAEGWCRAARGRGKARQARGAISQHNTGAVLTLRCATAAEDASLSHATPRTFGGGVLAALSWYVRCATTFVAFVAPSTCGAIELPRLRRTRAGAYNRRRGPRADALGWVQHSCSRARWSPVHQWKRAPSPAKTDDWFTFYLSHQVDQLLMTWDRLTATSDRRAQFGASTPRAPGG